MSLRIKTVVILFVSLLVVLAVFFAVLNNFIFTAFAELEKVHFEKLGTQVARTIQTEEQYFNAFVRDWGVWNDSYTFLIDRDQEFIDDNMAPGTLDSIGTLGVFYFDPEFNLHYSYTRPEDELVAAAVAEAVTDSRHLIEALDLKRNPSFYLCLKNLEGPFLAAMHPVLPTDRSQPANGYVLMGRPIDEEFSYKISQIAGYDFYLQKVCSAVCDDCGTGKGIEVFTRFIDDEYAEMLLNVRDIENHCSFKLMTKVYREMNLHLKRVFHITMVVIVILGLLGILLVEKLLNYLVLDPVSHQIRHFNRIADSADLTYRFSEQGSRELKLLSYTANRMLDKIHALNQQLHLASETDSLTGLWNRRRFDRQLRHDWLVAQRSQEAISLLMIDVDHFKLYNDTYGHQEGDLCLQRVAEVIGECLQREVDVATRYGGEEFAVILTGVDVDGAMLVAERIRQRVEALQLPNSGAGEDQLVTVSIGVAGMVVTRLTEAEDLLRKADQALYVAKQAGRNCCQVAR